MVSREKEVPVEWECAYWRTLAGGNDAYFSEYVDDISLEDRGKLPFFIAAVNTSDSSQIDITSDLRHFAWKGNHIGGAAFWEWFFLRFVNGVVVSTPSVTVIGGPQFKESDLDLSEVMLL